MTRAKREKEKKEKRRKGEKEKRRKGEYRSAPACFSNSDAWRKPPP